MSILLIDDDDDFSAMMADYLSSEGFECERALDPAAGLERALSGQFEAAIVDVMMPQLDGMEVLRSIRRQSALPVLMLTARGDNIDRVTGLELGADDYMSKPVYPREVVARLRAVLRRVHAEAPSQANGRDFHVGPLTISSLGREVHLNGRPCLLTTTEFNILIELVRRVGQVLSKDDLSELALHRPRQPYDRSIDVHISNIRHKLAKLDGGVEIDTVRAIGYRLRAVQP